MDRELGSLDRRDDHDLEQVPGAIRANDQPAVWIFASVFDCERMFDGVIDVLVHDTVLSRRLVELTRIMYYEKNVREGTSTVRS